VIDVRGEDAPAPPGDHQRLDAPEGVDEVEDDVDPEVPEADSLPALRSNVRNERVERASGTAGSE
jgi:hypothetical protein